MLYHGLSIIEKSCITRADGEGDGISDTTFRKTIEGQQTSFEKAN